MPRPSLHIIDDDEVICTEMSAALQASGFDCSWAPSADRFTGPGDREPTSCFSISVCPRSTAFR